MINFKQYSVAKEYKKRPVSFDRSFFAHPESDYACSSVGNISSC